MDPGHSSALPGDRRSTLRPHRLLNRGTGAQGLDVFACPIRNLHALLCPPSPQPSRAPKLRRSLDQITLSTRSAALVIKTRKEKPGCCRTRTRGAPPRRPEHLGWSPTSLSTGCTSTATPTAALASACRVRQRPRHDTAERARHAAACGGNATFRASSCPRRRLQTSEASPTGVRRLQPPLDDSPLQSHARAQTYHFACAAMMACGTRRPQSRRAAAFAAQTQHALIQNTANDVRYERCLKQQASLGLVAAAEGVRGNGRPAARGRTEKG